MPSARPAAAPLPAGLLAALAWLAASCAAGDPWRGGRAGSGSGAGEVRPTLEEVFLRPPVSGTSPSLAGVSADGRWALVRWSAAPGAERSRAAELRLVETGEARGDGRSGVGVPLLALLPPPAPGPPPPSVDLSPDLAVSAAASIDAAGSAGTAPPTGELFASAPSPAGEGAPPSLRAAFGRRGHRLAIARGTEVFLLDPESDDGPRRLLAWPAPVRPTPPLDEGEEEGEEVDEDAEEVGDDEDGAEETPAAALEEPGLGEVRGLFFSPDDARLGVTDGKEYFEVLLPPLGAGLADDTPPLTLDDALWWSREVESESNDLWWSRDHAVVLGNDPVPRPEADPEAQVWHVLEGRATVLAGVAEIEDLEDLALSPDGRFVFGVEHDRSDEPASTLVPDYLTGRVTTRDARPRLADDLAAPTRLWMWDTGTGAREELTFAAELPENWRRPWLRVVGWTFQPEPDSPARLLVERRSEDFREHELWCWSEGAFERLHHERDEGWIGGPARRATWTHDGARILFGSEVAPVSTTPDRSQLFVLDPADAAAGARQLTEVAGELTTFRPLGGGGVLVQFSGDDPGQRGYALVHPEAVRGETNAAPLPYATPSGWNAGARAAADGSRIVFLHEELLVPPELHAADHGSHVRLSSTTPAAFDTIDWVRPVRVVVASPDEVEVHAHVYLPPGVTLEEPGPPRATVVFVHGAGYLQNVTDSMTRYPLNAMFHSRLARLGYPVIDVDYRGSAGYGARFRRDVQYHLGGKDLDDIHLVVDSLVDAGVVDPTRVGIYGGSYGGFMAMMALFTAPERWAVGCALRSVTDWRTYNPGYSQPRLGRPSTHPEAYERSSPIDHVDGLEDPLLVLHGMMDSNVFAQDSIRLIEELIDLGKEFDAMLYPSQGHAFQDGEHWLDEYRRIERYLMRHLGPPLYDPEAIWMATGVAAGGWLQAAWVNPRGRPPVGAPTTRHRGLTGVSTGPSFTAPPSTIAPVTPTPTSRPVRNAHGR